MNGVSGKIMIIVIDGYNLLKAIFPKEKGRLDKQRRRLISQLGFYKNQRRETIKQIVLVFDGGLVGRATREIRDGIVVVFSGQKQNADDWIVDYVERNKEKELMLVSRDRELIQKCKKHNVEVLKVFDFYKIMQERLLESVEQDLIKDKQSEEKTDTIKKYKKESTSKNGEIESEALDILMEQAPVDFYEKEDVIKEERKKGRSRIKSKKEKKRISKLKKL